MFSWCSELEVKSSDKNSFADNLLAVLEVVLPSLVLLATLGADVEVLLLPYLLLPATLLAELEVLLVAIAVDCF
uniref:Uncharacterized protein n=1 Tax=Arundo donax TaxID=35708 RepID=A0A0A9FKR3_ARUDO